MQTKELTTKKERFDERTVKRTMLLFIATLCSLASMVANAQSGANDEKTLISVNLGHALVVPVAAKTVDANMLYLPVHINAYRSLNKHFALSGLLMYRAELGYDQKLSEFGIAVGPCFTSNYLKGFFVDYKIGLAYAAGIDYRYNDYTRTDFLIQPEVGYFLSFSNKFTMTFGFGFQTLLKISEYPKREDSGWEWEDIEKMSHYLLPVLNISLGVKF